MIPPWNDKPDVWLKQLMRRLRLWKWFWVDSAVGHIDVPPSVWRVSAGLAQFLQPISGRRAAAVVTCSREDNRLLLHTRTNYSEFGLIDAALTIRVLSGFCWYWWGCAVNKSCRKHWDEAPADIGSLLEENICLYFRSSFLKYRL